jgi:antitoxin Phd
VKTWKLEDAKNRFSELVRRALARGPQRVTRGGRDAVIVLSAADYERLVAPQSLVDFLRQSPFADELRDGALDLERPRDAGREVRM